MPEPSLKGITCQQPSLEPPFLLAPRRPLLCGTSYIHMTVGVSCFPHSPHFLPRLPGLGTISRTFLIPPLTQNIRSCQPDDSQSHEITQCVLPQSERESQFRGPCSIRGWSCPALGSCTWEIFCPTSLSRAGGPIPPCGRGVQNLLPLPLHPPVLYQPPPLPSSSRGGGVSP